MRENKMNLIPDKSLLELSDIDNMLNIIFDSTSKILGTKPKQLMSDKEDIIKGLIIGAIMTRNQFKFGGQGFIITEAQNKMKINKKRLDFNEIMS